MKKAAWLSRHMPTQGQRASLVDYQIVVIDGYPVRFMSARDAWLLTLTQCGRKPDLIVAIMPVGMLRKYMKLATDIPVIRPDMSKDFRWKGRWHRYINPGKYYEVWKP